MLIVHNEAIVRLLSSMWWAARIITWVSFISILLILLVLLFSHNSKDLTLFVLPTLAFTIAALLRWGITNQLHDLRIRELCQILTITNIMYRENKEWFKWMDIKSQ